MPRYLKKIGKNTIFGYNEILARRSDVVECDENGKQVDGAKPPPPADEVQTPAAVRMAKAKREEQVRLASEKANEKTPEELAAEEAKKADLIKFAKDRFQVDIDPADSLEVVEKRIEKLTGKAKPAKKTANGKAKAE